MARSHLCGFSVDLCLLLLTFLHVSLRATDAFNLDVRFPVVKEGKTKGSLFGLAVAFHKQTLGDRRYLVLVGAPKEETTLSWGVNKTGDAFYCPISIDKTDCGKMNLITSGTDQPDSNDAIVEGMWLGVSVASQNITDGRILVCGHRYVRKVNNDRTWGMIGRCYIRSNNMQYDPNDYHWQDYYEVCSPYNEQNQEGLCNMGISATITETEVVVGSPGSFEWQGNADIIWRSTNGYTDSKANFDNFKRRNIYMGYSVAKDKGLLSLTQDTLVAGAPRDGPEANLAKGSVIMTLVGNVKKDNQELGGINFTVYGEQTGSYFGGSVAIADLNNDNWKDLIVGAPFYFDRTKEEGGAVYIYLNENGSFKNKYDIALRGPEKSGFGMSVSAIGDINQDGFQDIAVGAPFHGTGAVFIWTGSEKGISATPSQVIKGLDIKDGGFQTFGYSVSGGMDIDGNNYPDVVVGSLDERIAVLRARPVIHLQSDLRVTPDIVDPENCVDCVEATICLSYILSTGENSKRNITAEFTLIADWTSRIPRLHFQDRKNSYTDYFYMPSEKCKTFKLQLKKSIRDKVEPVGFLLNVSLYEPKPRNRRLLQNLDAYPMLSEGKTVVKKHEIHFQKACGIDNKCNSNLKMTANFASFDNNQPFQVEDGRQIFKYNSDVKKLKLLIEVTNLQSDGKLAEDAHNTELNITVPSSLQFSAVNPKNLIECSSSELNLICEFGNPVGTNQETKVEIIFETSGITLDTQEITTEIQLSTLSEQSAIPPVVLFLMVEYSLQPTFIINPQNSLTYFSGEVMGESAMKTTRDVGSPVAFTFSVELQGKPLGTLGTLQISFAWPLEVANGKWLLYVTDITMTGTSQRLCVPSGHLVNPLNLPSTEAKGRRKRHLDSPEISESVQVEQALAKAALKAKGRRKNFIRLSCDTGGLKCRNFTCPLEGMNNSATLTIYARLWNSTMVEDYTDAYRVTVQGQATLGLQTSKAAVIMKQQTQMFTLDIDPELEEEAPKAAPIWIIVVSVLAGVLLLTVISLLLWKCGFFKRASTRELYEAKAQKAEMKSQPSEKDRLTEDI